MTEAAGGPTFTAVLSLPIAADAIDAFAGLHDLSVARMATMPGFVGSELLRPLREGDDAVVLSTFDTREHLEGWLRSDERRRLVDLQREHLVGPRTESVVGGFAGWFGTTPPGDEVVRWRSAVVVLLAIVPVSQLIVGIRTWLFPGAPVVVATVVGNVLTVITLTWGLMPPLTRHLAPWLHRTGPAA